MKPRSFTGALNQLLTPKGFERKGKEWLRTRDGYLELIELQISRYGFGAMVNIGFLDLASESILFETITAPVHHRNYAMYFRIGDLMGLQNKWWERDGRGPIELAEAVETYVLPFFDQTRSLEAQLQAFKAGRGANAARSNEYLAITLYRMGRSEEACRTLERPRKYASADWLAEIQALRGRLGCEDAADAGEGG